jgi:hypothetical protein
MGTPGRAHLSRGSYSLISCAIVHWIEQEGSEMNKGGFSWKRAVGITNAKRRVSRATGIPWTKSGRQRKVGATFWKLFK